MKKRISTFLLCLCLCLAAAAVPGAFSARAESGTTVGDFIVTGGQNGTDYTFEKGDAGKSRNGKLTVLTSTKLTISNVHALTATTDRIVIKKDAAAHIVLNYVWINTKMNDQNRNFPAALEIEDDSTADVTVEIAGASNLISGRGSAGIQKNGGKDSGTLRITGTTENRLVVQGGFGAAAIGSEGKGNTVFSAYHIYIQGGVISAVGGGGGAAIGCGSGCSDFGDIRIVGGSVKTTPGDGAAAIGSGHVVGEALKTCTVTSDGKKAVYLCLFPRGKKSLTIDGVAYPPYHVLADKVVYVYLAPGYHRVVKDGTPSVCLTDEKGNITDISYTVQYESNGGSKSHADKVIANREQALTLPDGGTRDGYIFSGWLYKGCILRQGDTLEDIESDLSVTRVTLTAVWTPTRQLMSDLDALRQAVDAVNTALKEKIDVSSFNTAVINLANSIQNAEKAAADADSQLKAELLAEIEKAKQTAISGAGPAIEQAKQELTEAISKKADADTVNAAVADLSTAITNAEAAAKAYADAQDSKLKAELTAAIAAAKTEAVSAANAALEQAKQELTEAISKKADADTVNAAVADLSTAITNAEAAAKAYADAQDSKLKAELTAAIAAAKTEMANAISALAENVDKAKNELSRALADGDSALLDKIKALSATLDALDEAYQAADREQDVSTERMTEEAKEVLNTANAVLAQRLDSVERRLDGLTAVTAAAVGVLVLFDAAALVLFFVWKKKKGL